MTDAALLVNEKLPLSSGWAKAGASLTVKDVPRFNLLQAPSGGSGSLLSLGRDRATAVGISPTQLTQAVPIDSQGDAAVLFDRLSAMKVLTSRIAMHLETAWRCGLFRNLDHLLDGDSWDLSEELPSVASFRTFLRMIIFVGQTMKVGQVRRPALGATANGTIVAIWSNGPERLTIECQPADQVRFVLSKNVGEQRVTNAGTAPVTFLPKALAAYDPEGWWRADNVRP